MTDIHLKPESGVPEAFKKAIDTAKTLNADFMLSGGDQVYDVLRGNFERSDSLFLMYKEAISELEIPVYHCVGNHELFGIYKESDIKPDHPDYKYGMFERHLGKTYYSFNHKNWHFITLNSLDELNQRYIGNVDSLQMVWLKEDLEKISPTMPIVLTLHLPLISVQKQIYPKNPATEVPNELWVYNRKEILDLFEGYNLKVVLQGHLHWIEDIQVNGKTRFITGGAIAGRPSWRGDRSLVKEGFMLFKVKGEEIEWDYIDYGLRK